MSAGLLRSASPLIVGRGVAAFFTLAIPIVLARRLPPAEYGTYKQFFLLASSVVLVLQLGLPASLYFFLPRVGTERGRYLIQTLCLLLCLGALAALLLLLLRDPLSRWFDNPALSALIPSLALYAFAMLGSVPLEPSLTSSGRPGWAGVVYAISDTLRAAAMVLPMLLGFGLRMLALSAAAFALVRLVAAWSLALSGGLGSPGLPRRDALAIQLGYAVPFAGAVLLTVAQSQLQQYLIAALTDSATFALFAVGTLQIPLTDLLYAPVSEVMMVKLAHAERAEKVSVFREAVSRLLVFFLPLCAFSWAVGSELIPTLYTERYRAATTVFVVSVTEVLLSAFPVDGLLRALDATRTLFVVGALRLAAAIVTVPLGLTLFGLPGAAGGFVLVQLCAKTGLLLIAQRRLGSRDLLPWRSLGYWAAGSALLFVALRAIHATAHLTGWSFLMVAGATSVGVWSLLLRGESSLTFAREAT